MNSKAVELSPQLLACMDWDPKLPLPISIRRRPGGSRPGGVAERCCQRALWEGLLCEGGVEALGWCQGSEQRGLAMTELCLCACPVPRQSQGAQETRVTRLASLRLLVKVIGSYNLVSVPGVSALRRAPRGFWQQPLLPAAHVGSLLSCLAGAAECPDRGDVDSGGDQGLAPPRPLPGAGGRCLSFRREGGGDGSPQDTSCLTGRSGRSCLVWGQRRRAAPS